jgi:hypothetical protein
MAVKRAFVRSTFVICVDRNTKIGRVHHHHHGPAPCLRLRTLALQFPGDRVRHNTNPPVWVERYSRDPSSKSTAHTDHKLRRRSRAWVRYQHHLGTGKTERPPSRRFVYRLQVHATLRMEKSRGPALHISPSSPFLEEINTPTTMDNSTGAESQIHQVKFFPPLHEQRRSWALEILRRERVTSVGTPPPSGDRVQAPD